MKYLAILLLSFFLVQVFTAERFQDEEMMKAHHNEKYPANGPDLTVHLIPHSHDDVGWLKTVDNYFYGGDMRTQFAGVQYTIDTVVSELTQHPEYKFSIVEVAFLYRWWNGATEKQRQQMKALVANGQIQFINGGWCMSDQANMYYEDFVDQMTVGLRWLKQTFNVVPNVAWHIDPFGHHASSASLFSKMGFQSFFFARIDYQDKEVRLANKGMEMIWRPLQYSGDQSTYIFTHVNYYHYSPPPGFCFDDVCRDEPIKDDPTLEDYNIIDRANSFVSYFKSMALHYRTTNLMHTLGEDFQYTNSRMWFKNVDKLLKFINDRPQLGVKIKYSTPGQYIDAIQKEGATYPTKTDDFFPYADNQHAFWTGYFVSRVALKGFVKDFSRFTQAARKYISELKITNVSQTIRDNTKNIQEKIFGLQMALGILQHHDAVAGTAKQKVTNDYVATGLKSINEFNKLLKDIKSEDINTEIGQKVNAGDIYVNLFWNESAKVTGVSDKILGNKTVLVSFYNPGAKGIFPIRVKVPPHELNIVSSKNVNIGGDVICNNLQDANDCELLFSLDVEESSTAYVKLVPVKSGGSAKVEAVKELSITEQIKTFQLGTDTLKITRGSQKFDLTIGGALESFNIFYNNYDGWFSGGQNSGAYIFRPILDNPKLYSTIKKIHYCDGTKVAIVILEGDKTLTKIYFSKTANYVKTYGFEIETFIDSIPVVDGIGKEITLNFKTSYANNKTFYTDSQGLEQQKRVKDFRPTWPYVVHEPTSGNYYPINSHIRIQDINTNNSVSIIADRSQGGAVIRDGEIEIMIHRRLLHDDGRGVGEPLNESDSDGKGLRQSVRHYVVFGNANRQVQKNIDQKIMITFAPTSTNNFTRSYIRKAPISVPDNVKLYLRPFDDGSYLLRLHNFNTIKPATVTFGDEWKLVPYTLAANQLNDDWKKNQYKWNQDKADTPSTKSWMKWFKNYLPDLEASQSPSKKSLTKDYASSTITLLPFDIQTFKAIKA